MKCACGQKLRRAATFCPRCGKPKSPLRCKCGGAINDNLVCIACGSKRLKMMYAVVYPLAGAAVMVLLVWLAQMFFGPIPVRR